MSQGFKGGSKWRTNIPAYPFLYLLQQFQVATRSTSPDMTTVFHTWSYGRFIEIQSNLRRKRLHRTNQGSSTGSSRGSSTDSYSDKLHDFSVIISRYYKDGYINSFFPHSTKLWICLPIECFLLTYDLCGFKSRINRHLLTLDSFLTDFL